MATDPRDFLLNTDYEMDKIVYFTSGEIMPDNISPRRYVDNFNLGFIPLVFAVFSFNEDFSDARMNWTQQGFTSGSDRIEIQLYAVSDGVVVVYLNEVNPNQKLYYRIYGFEPTNSTSNVASTQKDAKQFILNTDYSYCKLYKKGIASTNTTISHNLGYIPLVLAWNEDKWTNPSPSIISPTAISGAAVANLPNIDVTNNELIINGIRPNSKVHYRIYYDEV